MATRTPDYRPAKEVLDLAAEMLNAVLAAALDRLAGVPPGSAPSAAGHLQALTREVAEGHGDDRRIACQTVGFSLRRKAALDRAPGLAIALLAQVGDPTRKARADAIPKSDLWKAAGAAVMLRARGDIIPRRIADWIRRRYLTGERHYPDLLQPAVFWRLVHNELQATPWRAAPGASDLRKIAADFVSPDDIPGFVEQLVLCEHARLAEHEKPAAPDSTVAALPLAGAAPFGFHDRVPDTTAIPTGFLPYFSDSSGP